MGFTIVKCPKCGKTLDRGFSGQMGVKWALEIAAKPAFRSCYRCGAEFLYRGEWTQSSTYLKLAYLGRTALFLGFGGLFTWFFLSTGFFSTKATMGEVLFLPFVFVMFGPFPLGYGICRVVRIFQSIDRTSQGNLSSQAGARAQESSPPNSNKGRPEAPKAPAPQRPAFVFAGIALYAKRREAAINALKLEENPFDLGIQRAGKTDPKTRSGAPVAEGGPFSRSLMTSVPRSRREARPP